MTAADQAAPPRLAFDRFPTTVQPPDGPALRDARVIVTCPDSDRDVPAKLWVWASPGDPVVVASIDLAASSLRSGPRSWDVVTDAGRFLVEPGRGCGCSNRLKTWQPFAPMIMGSPRCLKGGS